MELEEIEELLEKYGFCQILSDFEMTEALVLQVLNECRYINLEEYDEE